MVMTLVNCWQSRLETLWPGYDVSLQLTIKTWNTFCPVMTLVNCYESKLEHFLPGYDVVYCYESRLEHFLPGYDVCLLLTIKTLNTFCPVMTILYKRKRCKRHDDYLFFISHRWDNLDF